MHTFEASPLSDCWSSKPTATKSFGLVKYVNLTVIRYARVYLRSYLSHNSKPDHFSTLCSCPSRYHEILIALHLSSDSFRSYPVETPRTLYERDRPETERQGKMAKAEALIYKKGSCSKGEGPRNHY